MKEFLQSGKITELKNTQNVSYMLEEASLFNLTGYKVLKSQESSVFIPCAKVLHNGKIKLLYFTSGHKNLKSMLSLIDTNTFIIIVSNILKSVIDIKNNGFLSCQNLDLSFDKIFVDSHTLKVKFIYVPINNENDDIMSFENDLRTDLIKVITSTPSLSNQSMSKISSYLSNGSLSLTDLYKSIRSECSSMGSFSKIESGESQIANDSSNRAKQPQLIMTSLDRNNPLKLVINSPNYILGKNPVKVNGVISFNKAIGRVHCSIIFNNGYFIIDGDGTKPSTNGTYVNNVRLRNASPFPIKNGDVVRLANSDFSISY